MSHRRISIFSGSAIARDDRGIALVLAILMTGLLGVLAIGLTMLTMVETWLSAGVRTSQELSYASHAAIARVQVDLLRTGDWTLVLSGASVSAFDDGRNGMDLTGGTAVDLSAETIALQTDSDRSCGSRSAMPDCPLWRLYGHAPVANLVSGRTAATSTYVGVWVADDLSDSDGDPTVDANGRLLVRASAFGPSNARRSVEALFSRVGPASIRLLSSKELR